MSGVVLRFPGRTASRRARCAGGVRPNWLMLLGLAATVAVWAFVAAVMS